MKLNAPKKVTFICCLIAALLSIVFYFVKVPILNTIAFPLLACAFIVLAASNYFSGL